MLMNVDDNTPTVHHYTDSEIVQMVFKSGAESSDEKEEDAAERVSINLLFIIQLCSELIKCPQQCSFVSEQEIMNIYMYRIN